MREIMEILILDAETGERIGVANFSDIPRIGTHVIIGNNIHRYGHYLEEMTIKVEDVYTFSWKCMNAKDGLSSIPNKFLIQNEDWGKDDIPRYRLPQVFIVGRVVNNHWEFTNGDSDNCDINLDFIRNHPEKFKYCS